MPFWPHSLLVRGVVKSVHCFVVPVFSFVSRSPVSGNVSVTSERDQPHVFVYFLVQYVLLLTHKLTCTFTNVRSSLPRRTAVSQLLGIAARLCAFCMPRRLLLCSYSWITV